MVIYHSGAAFEPSVTRKGAAFVASVSILEEDGQSTSLGELGIFATEESALRFAVWYAAAFIEGHDLPVPPLRSVLPGNS
ncbi:hypothetical protein [Caballeronia sp. AZ1_KS37]|uniref:hypothetical protein n=1 Tax=Caballeronia sp. AZ1_KS37 TaxID=2921756 RepID=UPI0020281CCC|nr:hypothetical protein [Caballeronia sp. AZ1_KS37]